MVSTLGCMLKMGRRWREGGDEAGKSEVGVRRRGGKDTVLMGGGWGRGGVCQSNNHKQ